MVRKTDFDTRGRPLSGMQEVEGDQWLAIIYARQTQVNIETRSKEHPYINRLLGCVSDHQGLGHGIDVIRTGTNYQGMPSSCLLSPPKRT